MHILINCLNYCVRLTRYAKVKHMNTKRMELTAYTRDIMKKLLIGLLLLSSPSVMAYTLKTDFLRVAQKFENAQFPLDITGHLDLSFRVTIEDGPDTDGIMAHVERRMDGDLVSSYSGIFKFGQEVWVEFPDGNKGPKMIFEQSAQEKKAAQPTEKTANTQ